MTELDKRHRSSIYDKAVKSTNRAMPATGKYLDKDLLKHCWGY